MDDQQPTEIVQFAKKSIHRSPITEYFQNAEIFVTGGTGFLGKSLIEKLLLSCDGVDKIYVLLRTKRGHSCEERWEDFLKDPFFDRVRQKNPALLSKLECITGDISATNLGMSETDCTNVLMKVNIVFHVAATIRFNEELKVAARQNTFGTRELLLFCSTLKHLKSVVHVSTAYSNPTRKNIDEIVYPTDPIDKDSFMKCFNLLSDDTIDCIKEKLQGTHPNTYTLTKSMAESIVADYSAKLPICIVRPSIVTGAILEPWPGFVDNIAGVTGVLMEIARGTLTSAIGDNSAHLDVVPVDIVVNTMITAAWANSFSKSNKIQVYNCITGQINGITWKDFMDKLVKYARRNPTKHVMLYPSFTLRKSHRIDRIIEILYHFLPAYIFDFLARIQGDKPLSVRIAKRTAMNIKVVGNFIATDFHFGTKNMRALSDIVKRNVDGAEFDCDVRDMNWDQYIETYLFGIRKFVLKDDMGSMKAARSKIQMLYWTRTVFYSGIFLLLVYFVCVYIFKLFA